MPEIRSPDVGRRLVRELDTEAGAFGTIAPELVPVVIVSDVSRPIGRSGCAGVAVAAGGAGLRSEVSMIVPVGVLGAGVVLFVKSIVVLLAAATNVEVFVDLTVSAVGATDFTPQYGDRVEGTSTPFIIRRNNTLVLTAGGRNYLGSDVRIPANVPTIIPVNCSLRETGSVPQRSTNSILMIRPTGDNVAMEGILFEWEIRSDVR